jgi:hypothetical protein
MNIGQQKISEVAIFRRRYAESLAAAPGRPLSEVVDLAPEPDETAAQTYLMELACELLLRLSPVLICKGIVDSRICDFEDDWYDPLRIAVAFVEAEDAGEFVVA